jgi:hypothetical protein
VRQHYIRLIRKLWYQKTGGSEPAQTEGAAKGARSAEAGVGHLGDPWMGTHHVAGDDAQPAAAAAALRVILRTTTPKL